MPPSRRIARGRILKIDLETCPGDPLHRRIYESIRRDIAGGLLSPGSDLPSTRGLATDLGVARGTVVMAYEQLRAEGYLEADAGGGTRVTRNVPDCCVRAPEHAPSRLGPTASPRASVRGRVAADRLDDIPMDFRGDPPRAFRSTPPAVDVFPVDIWSRIAGRQWRRATTRDLSYADPMGYPPLRATIAAYVGSTRGVRCTADQVLIVSGTQHGVDLALRAVVDAGDKVWMEDPGYFGFRGAIVANAAHPVPVGVDREGIDVEEGRRVAPDARMAFVTPMHQVPLCVPMSARRRAELLAWAEEQGAWIFEDDYNSDFHYSTRPGVALRAMDGGNHVIYCGTFSKSLFPGLRIGFIVAPESLLREFRAVRFFSDLQPSYLEQATLAEFIAEGHYERHIRRLRSIYQSRRDCLLDGLAQCVAWLTPTRYDSGREVTVWLDPRLNDVIVAGAADRAGVTVMPLSPWATAHALGPSLRLGYSGIDEKDIQTGVTRLARVLESLHPAPHRAVPLPGVSEHDVAVVAAVQDHDASSRIEGHRGSAAARGRWPIDLSPGLVDERPG